MDQATCILRFLKSGKKLTPLDALRRFDCLRLSGRIFDLRCIGYDIDKKMVKTKSGKVVAQYSMPRQK